MIGEMALLFNSLCTSQKLSNLAMIHTDEDKTLNYN